MFSLSSPSCADAPLFFSLRPGGQPVVFGRSKQRYVIRNLALRGKRRLSVDADGVARFLDRGSVHGTLLLPARGKPRLLPANRTVALWPGDAVAVGCALPDAPTEVFALQNMHILKLEESFISAERDDAEEQCGEMHDAECAVCHELLRRARVLPCGHLFCDDCLSRWLRARDTCPTCRTPCDERVLASAGAPCAQVDALVRALVEARTSRLSAAATVPGTE